MNRIVTTRDMGGGTVRHKVRIESDDCEPQSYFAEQVLYMLLQNIAQNPALVACGPGPFQKLAIFHDNQRWIIEAEALRESTHVQSKSDTPQGEA